MLRRPPRSPLFPCTTLSQPRRERHRRALEGEDRQVHPLHVDARELGELRVLGDHASRAAQARSEEHTSELQSRQYHVCRLLLEKTNVDLISAFPVYRTYFAA